MKKVKINILDKHIKNAVRGDATSCMVAQAIKDQLQINEQLITVSVDQFEIELYDIKKDEATITRTPDEIGDLITGWDDGKDTEPFSVEINIP